MPTIRGVQERGTVSCDLASAMWIGRLAHVDFGRVRRARAWKGNSLARVVMGEVRKCKKRTVYDTRCFVLNCCDCWICYPRHYTLGRKSRMCYEYLICAQVHARGREEGAKKKLTLLRSHCLGTRRRVAVSYFWLCVAIFGFSWLFRLLVMTHIPLLSSLDHSLMVLSFPPLTIHAASLVTSALKTGPE